MIRVKMIGLKKLFFNYLLLVASSISYNNGKQFKVEASKLDCYPIVGVTKEKCESFGCIWEPINDFDSLIKKSRVDEPWCYFPYRYDEGYQIVSTENFAIDENDNNIRKLGDQQFGRIVLKRFKRSALSDDIENVHVNMYQLNNGNLLRIKVVDADKVRYEPQLPRLSFSESRATKISSNKFSITLNDRRGASFNNNALLTIRRTSNNAILFSTDLNKLIFAEKFIQLNSKLSSPFVYGLGEHFDNFLKKANETFKTYSFWNTDKTPPPDGGRTYGSFPFYINYEQQQQQQTAATAHGIYLHNSNAMDIILQKDQSITFRPIGGILDFFLFIGPKPLDVIEHFQNLVGLPSLPPRWALGFHLCRYNYGSLERTRLIWNRTRAADIPFDVQWNDIDYMNNYNDFTYDEKKFANLPEFVNDLHDKYNMHYMLLFDPGLSQEADYYPYKLGSQLDIWIKNATDGILIGKVWNQSGRTVFPDFSNPLSGQFWTELFVKFQHVIKFDGAWIDMNDISNFVTGSLDGCPANNSLESTPYMPGGYSLQTNSLCLSAKHYNNQVEYDVHNLYAFYEAIATSKALEVARPNKRSLIISRSSYAGQGHYGGHWSGDVFSDWNYLKWSIASLLEHSMYGYSMIGTDICGFRGNTTPELCARWSTLGAFYTFSRNHNDDTSIDQDPVALGDIVVQANRNAYRKKYSLLPYLYTQIYKAHLYGQPVARSMGFEFFQHNDMKLLFSSETQFMLGSAIMISPIVEQNSFTLKSYLPKGRWYQTDILPQSAYKIPKLIQSTGQWIESRNISLDNLVLFIRGGHIVPHYLKVGPTIKDTVEGQPISLEVALCAEKRAHGSLLEDDGESNVIRLNQIEMIFENENSLNLTMLTDHYSEKTRFEQIRIYGLEKLVSNVRVRGGQSLEFIQIGHMLRFNLESAPLSKNQSMLIDFD